MANDIRSWSTTAASNTSVDGIDWTEGMQPEKVNDSARQMMASTRAFIGDVTGELVAGGTANALTLAANCGFSAYADGVRLSFKASNTNTGATTLNANSIGAKAIRKMSGSTDAALVGGEIIDEGVYDVVYSEDANSAAGGWILLNPTQPSRVKGPDIASASTLTLGDGHYFDVTGTTTITAISSAPAGTVIRLQFDGALTLTHNGTSLVLPWGSNIPTQAGDIAVFVSEDSGNWRCVSYSPDVRYGSNSNGHYERHLNGTQRCWIRVSSSSVALNTSYGSIPLYYGDYSWTFPVAFSNNPTVTCGAFKWGSSASWPGSPASPSTTDVTLRGMDTASRATGTATLIAAEAVGRWF